MLDYTGVGAAQFDEPTTMVWGTSIPIVADTKLKLTLRIAKIAGANAVIVAGLICYDEAGNDLGQLLTINQTVSFATWQEFEATYDTFPAGTVSVLQVFQHQTDGSTIQVDEFSYEDVTAVLAAKASVEASQIATTKSDEAGDFALAASQERLAAQTANVSATSASVTAVTAKEDAEGYAASALSSRNLTLQAANDTQASVDQLATITADYNNTLSAGYLIKVQANGQASLLDLIAGDGSAGSVSIAKLEAKDIILNGSVSMPQLSVGLGRNELNNSTFDMGIGHISLFTTGTGGNATVKLARTGSYWDGVSPSLELYQSNNLTGGYADAQFQNYARNQDTYRDIPVTPGTFYEFSIATSALRCQSMLFIRWYTAAGGLISTSTAPIFQRTEPSTDANTWGRDHIIAVSPPNAAFARPVLRKYPTNSGSTSFLFALRPMFARTHAAATQPTPYEPDTSTFIDGSRIITKSITADTIDVATLSAISATLGLFKSAATGARVEIQDDRITVYRANGTVAVKIGNLA